ncbi:hypothetical protein WH47_03121 [Habropoda laboriosa]|uniref:Histone-lysine N-methyltransferase SETMAR n=1 Tax=Habropoda laboriosa TaxID=597456 RepID=A0A0L7QWF4_9HYME|nr:hypothetical protein WH47_03121 [Habropoda laboriosa]
MLLGRLISLHFSRCVLYFVLLSRNETIHSDVYLLCSVRKVRRSNSSETTRTLHRNKVIFHQGNVRPHVAISNNIEKYFNKKRKNFYIHIETT